MHAQLKKSKSNPTHTFNSQCSKEAEITLSYAGWNPLCQGCVLPMDEA